MTSVEITTGHKTLFRHIGKAITASMLLTGLLSTAHAAGNPVTGKIKAISCQVCHGKDGHSSNPIYPKLAGQHASYLVKQMRDFKSGKRVDPVMNEMAPSLSDQDIEDIAAYFESINIKP